MTYTPFDPFLAPEHMPLMVRSGRIQRLIDLYEGTQYEGRPDWWTGYDRSGAQVPLRQRKPCIIYRLPKAACGQVVSFLFGDRHFPQVEIDEGDAEALGEETAETLQTWIAKFIDFAHVKPRLRALARRGISRGTAVAILGVVDGRFTVDTPEPHHCWAEFINGNPLHGVSRLVHSFQFDREVADADGRPTIRRYCYRREWDDRNVLIYDDVLVEPGRQIEWGPPTVVSHGLSFCPVIWVKNEAEDCPGPDGRSLFEDSHEEVEALDMTLSRRHQGLIYFGTPQPYETGVAEDDGPGAVSAPANGNGYSSPHGQVKRKARRVGSESVWRYEGEAVKVGLLETSGKAFEVGTLHVNDIRSRLLETWSVVLTSMSDTVARVTTGAEMSAKFLALAHAPLLALVGEYRHTWWPYALERLLQMALRIVADIHGRQTEAGVLEISVPGTDDVVDVARSFYQAGRWAPPVMTPKWGRFFEAATGEVQQLTQATDTALKGGFISRKTAVSSVAHDFRIDDPDEELEEIQGDADQETERQMALQDAANHSLTRLARDVGDEAQTGGGAQAKPTREVGAGGSATSTPKKRSRRSRGRRGSGGG